MKETDFPRKIYVGQAALTLRQWLVNSYTIPSATFRKIA